ncbi:MAG: signal peptidase I, partial [Arenicellales bacterium]|nr:signal peptidase I [Arenicellales bacterium]
MDFSVWLFGAAVVTGVITLWDVLWGRKGREAKGRQHEPVLVAYGKAFFPVILIVFCLRSFLVEPFRIPSGSMLPTLNIGDFILVNKFDYGLRLPILNKKLVELDSPQRGEVMVFRFPQDPSVHFIKRIVGLPGDEILIRNKRLIINGEPVPL